MTEVVWRPDPSTIADTNVGRFMAAHDIVVVRRAAGPIGRRPGLVLGRGGRVPRHPVRHAVDRGARHVRRHPVGPLVHRRHDQPRCRPVSTGGPRSRPAAEAVRWEGEDGEVRTLTYEQLQTHVDGLAWFLHAIAASAPATRSASSCRCSPRRWWRPWRSPSSAPSSCRSSRATAPTRIVVRLNDAEAKALITADGFLRRGSVVPMHGHGVPGGGRRPHARHDDRGAAAGPAAGATVDARRRRAPYAVFLWPDACPTSRSTRWPVDSEHPLFIAYTSGTTGKPEGVGARPRRVHGEDRRGGGVPVRLPAGRPPVLVRRLRLDHGAVGDHRRAGQRCDRLPLRGRARPSPTPTGCGPTSSATGSRSSASARRSSARSWPTATSRSTAHDLSKLRILGSTGEPWNEEPWRWYFEVVGGGRCPVINISGGTEVGACFLSPHPVQELTPMTLGGPALGMAVDVFDDDGQPGAGRGRRAGVHEAVAGHDPGSVEGPRALPRDVLEPLAGRVGARRLGARSRTASGTCRAAATTRSRSPASGSVRPRSSRPSCRIPAVAEAAAVGVPDELKGEALWAYVVLAAGVEPSEELRAELVDRRRRSPGQVVPAERGALHRGRCRRPAARRCCGGPSGPRRSGADPGDLSSLEDPACLEAVRDAR